MIYPRSKYKLIFMLVILTAMGCENVIDLKLKNTEPRIVIEGFISDHIGESRFVITKTTDYFNPSFFPYVSGALVIISDDIGSVDTLVDNLRGVYLAGGFRGIIGRTYFASVTIEGKTYQASSFMPDPLTIFALRTEYQTGGGFGSDQDEGYRLFVDFYDEAGVDNFCRIKVSKNYSLFLDNYLYDDKYTDGCFIDYEYDGDLFAVGDTVSVDLLSMDRAVYGYFETLSSVIADDQGDGPQVAPANPNSNWSNGALGYFGAFSDRSKSMIVLPDR